jgi:hypothetical protein
VADSQGTAPYEATQQKKPADGKPNRRLRIRKVLFKARSFLSKEIKRTGQGGSGAIERCHEHLVLEFGHGLAT